MSIWTECEGLKFFKYLELKTLYKIKDQYIELRDLFIKIMKLSLEKLLIIHNFQATTPVLISVSLFCYTAHRFV